MSKKFFYILFILIILIMSSALYYNVEALELGGKELKEGNTKLEVISNIDGYGYDEKSVSTGIHITRYKMKVETTLTKGQKLIYNGEFKSSGTQKYDFPKEGTYINVIYSDSKEEGDSNKDTIILFDTSKLKIAKTNKESEKKAKEFNKKYGEYSQKDFENMTNNERKKIAEEGKKIAEETGDPTTLDILQKLDQAMGAQKQFDTSIYTKPDRDKTGTSSSEQSLDDMIQDADSFTQQGQLQYDQDSLQNFSKTMYNILLAIGVVVAVIVGAIIGIKLMASSVEEKAEVKKLLVPYIVGCVIVFGGFAIWKIVVDILQGM